MKYKITNNKNSIAYYTEAASIAAVVKYIQTKLSNKLTYYISEVTR